MQPLCVLLEQVFGGAILQQTVVVEFIVNGQMCDDCRRREAKDFWRAVVQVRQKVRTCVWCLSLTVCAVTLPDCVWCLSPYGGMCGCASKDNSGMHIHICMYPHTIVGRYLSTMCCVCCHFP